MGFRITDKPFNGGGSEAVYPDVAAKQEASQPENEDQQAVAASNAQAAFERLLARRNAQEAFQRLRLRDLVSDSRARLDEFKTTIASARGAEDEMGQVAPIVVQLAELIGELAAYPDNHDAEELKEEASHLHDDLVDRCFELFKQQIEDLPPLPPLELYFQARDAIDGSEAFSEAQRAFLLGLLGDSYEEFRSEILESEAAEEVSEEETVPADIFSARINNDQKTEVEIGEQIDVIRGAWDDLYVHGIWRQLAVEQIQRALDNGGSEDAITDATHIIDDALELDRQAIEDANEAASNLPSNLAEDSRYMVPRLEDIMTTVLDEIGVEPPPMVSTDPLPLGRQELIRDIGNAAANGYAAYLRDKRADIRSVDDDVLRSMGSEIMAPAFVSEFEIFSDQGHITGIVATPTNVEIPREGASFPVEEIAERIIQSIGESVRMPCYMHFIRIKLKFEVNLNEVTATIIE